MTKREKIIAGCAAVGSVVVGVVCYKVGIKASLSNGYDKGWARGVQETVHLFFDLHQKGMLKFFNPNTGDVVPDLLDLEKLGLYSFH